MFILIINIYGLKDGDFKNLLVFSQKIEDLTIFSSSPSAQRGNRQKQPFRAPTDLVYKIRHGGVYFAKMGCKIEDGFTDSFGVGVRHLG